MDCGYPAVSKFILLVLMLAAWGSGMPTVRAAERPSAPNSPDGGQMERPKEKPGLHVGGFRIRPSVTLGVVYDDNIFTTDTNTETDRILTVSPQLKINSTWARHSLRFNAGVDVGIYDQWDNENYLDHWSKVDGRIDVNDQTRLFAGFGHESGHEGRDSPDADAGALEPTTFRSINANIGARLDRGDVGIQLGATYEQLAFDDSPTLTGKISNSDRDRALLGLGLRVSRRLANGGEVFIQALLDWRDYDQTVDQSGFHRDSDGYQLAGGIERNLSDMVEVETYLGILSRSYDDRRFSNIRRPNFGGRLTVTPDDASKLTLELQRSVNETTETGSPGYLKTALSGKVERRYFGRLTPFLNAGYSVSDYFATDRQDKDYSLSAGLKFFVTRNAYMTAGASHSRRDSRNVGTPASGDEFRKNIVFVNVTAQLYPLN